MFLESIDITNFRGIDRLSLRLEQSTVLIGENNTGKSTILDALLLALDSGFKGDRHKFVKDDHRLTGTSGHVPDGDTISIVLRFAERQSDEWPEDATQKLRDVIQFDDAGMQSVTLRVQSVYDSATGESNPEWDFLNSNMNPLPAKAPQYRRILQSLAPVFPLHSTRSWGQESRYNSRFWGPFVRSLNMEQETRRELENELAGINRRIVSKHESFGAVKEEMGRISKLVPLKGDNPVSIEALPTNAHDILSKTRIALASITGANVLVGRHGDGTQNLAIMCLFLAYLRSKMREQYKTASPILVIEEPEAHLHPSAAYSVARLLDNPSGQNLISTHSGDLIANTNVSSLRFLRRREGRITAHRMDTDAFRPVDRQAIDHHIQSTRGNILFARCWLLVEGKTDRLVFEGCAQICDKDLMSNGVYCIEYTQIGGLWMLIRLAKQIGIEWFVVADGDGAGKSNVKKASGELGGEDAKEHIQLLDHNIDVLLCMAGYGVHYEGVADSLPDKSGEVDYWMELARSTKKMNVRAAAAAVNDMGERGPQSIPDIIRRIIDTTIRLAEGR